MSEEVKVEMTPPVEGEMPKAEPAKVEVKADTEDKANAEAELEKLRKALKDANKEAAERRKRLEELEAAEAKRKEAEMTEAQKQEAKLKELETQKQELENKVKQQERRELQRVVAHEVGLPEGFAERLKGETKEEMTEDAKALLELMPKQEAVKQPAAKQPVLNPDNAMKGETTAQKKARIFGQRVNTWDSDFAKQHSGGDQSAP